MTTIMLIMVCKRQFALIDDEEELERLVLAYSPRLRTILDAARQRIRAGAGIRHEDLWQELESGNQTKRPIAGPDAESLITPRRRPR